MEKEDIILRIDDGTIAILEQEIKKKRDLGVANSVGDKFLIRLLEALRNHTKVFVFKIEKNKLVIKNYSSLTYDNHRQTGTENREINGASA
jgi:hypothetical protein